MAQEMLFCFANISAKILQQVLSYSSCAKHHILAHLQKMLLPSKASKIMCP
jgi:hypothetical protein